MTSTGPTRTRVTYIRLKVESTIKLSFKTLYNRSDHQPKTNVNENNISRPDLAKQTSAIYEKRAITHLT